MQTVSVSTENLTTRDLSTDEIELIIDALEYYMQHNIKVMPRPLSEKKALLAKLVTTLNKLY